MFLSFALPFSTVQQSTQWFLTAIVTSTVLFVAVMAMLHRLSPKVKKWVTIICTFLAGIYFLLAFFLPPDPATGQNIVDKTVPGVADYMLYIFMWTVLLGVISLVLVHGRKLLKREPGWNHSLAFFIAMISMIVFGFWCWNGLVTSSPVTSKVAYIYSSLFSGLLLNLDAAMFSLLAFYIASAAYRAFRIRTVEAALLMFSALIIMLGFVNFGVALTNWINPDSGLAFFRVERFATWILNWINMPTQRAVAIGVSIGGLAMAMRLWLSLERGTFFSQE